MVEFLRKREPLLDDCKEQIGGQSCPDLYTDGVFGLTEKRLDPQVLLYPFEEEFHLPALLVQPGDYQGGQDEIIGEKVVDVACFWVAIFDSSQTFGI